MEWTNETRKLKDLLPNARNPRRVSKRMSDKLGESVDEFGVCDPLIINLDGEIIGGHTRVKQLLKMGFEEVPVRIPSKKLTRKQCDKLCLLLNKATGGWDDNCLANEWEEDILLEGGFTREELCIDAPVDGEESPKKCMISINFVDPEQLKDAEERIEELVDLCPGATYKVKIK